ncbi:MAG: HugZ family protein [Pseudolabrys sp.]|nr:HugZ family protein [Pseudolabrys sp.]
MKADNAFEPAAAAKKLLREARSGALATLLSASGDPYCSLVNVATDAAGAPLLLLSTLAVHTKNLLADARASLMLDERKAGDPLEGARIMLMGRVVVGARDHARMRYLSFHPEAADFAQFKDFAFYRFEIARVHLVAGFGRIVDLAATDVLTDLADAQALLEAEAGAVAHMNEDHKEALALYATKLLGAEAGDWRCAGIDPEGIDLQNGQTGLRLAFPQRVTAAGPLRQLLAQLAEKARTK